VIRVESTVRLLAAGRPLTSARLDRQATMLIKLLGIEDNPLRSSWCCDRWPLGTSWFGHQLPAVLRLGRKRFHPTTAQRGRERTARSGVRSRSSQRVLTMRFTGFSTWLGKALLNRRLRWPWLIASGFSTRGHRGRDYWLHRALHSDSSTTPDKYHTSSASRPLVSTAFFTRSTRSRGVPHHLCGFLFPVHAIFYLFMVGL